MKKILRIPLLLVALLLSSIPLSAHDFEVDGIYYGITNESAKTVVVTYSNDPSFKYSGDVVIPETVTYFGTTYSVTCIWERAFFGCTSLTSVTIPNSVTSIGSSAFYGCTSLTSVTIPNSMTSIGILAFNGTGWYNNHPDGILYLDNCCLGWKSSSSGDPATGELILNKNTRLIADGAFYGHFITSVAIPNTVISIGSRAFSDCLDLTSVTIPNSVTHIGDGAFSGCLDLTEVTIGNSVTHIGSGAFNGCDKLTSVNIPNSVTSIGIHAFNSTGWYLNHPDGILYLDNCCLGWKGSEPEGKLILNTRLIADDAFDNCKGLTSVTIGNSVTHIGDGAFSGCSGLTSVTIGNSVTHIGDGAFYRCHGLTSVTIPNSVTHIGSSAFWDCSGLTEVTIGNSVTHIGFGAFNGCSGLTSVTIGNSVTHIGFGAFFGCSGLTSVTIGNSVTHIGFGAFNGCSGLTSVTIGNSVTHIGSGAFNGCSGLTSVTIPNSVTHIGSNAFDSCSGLTSVTIGNSVTHIGDGAFNGCSGLTSVTIPNSVTHIGSGAFNGCKGLTSVTIPNSVTHIGSNAFDSCSGLTEVTIGNSVTSIGDYAFYRCHGLTSIISLNPEPPLCSDEIFWSLNDNTILYVPKGSVNDYSNAYGWSKFTNIIELDENGEIPEVEVAVGNGEATISFPKEENIVECKMSIYTTIPGSTVVKESVWVDNASRSSSSQISMNVDGLDVGNYIYRISVKYESGEIEEKYAGKFSINVSGIDDIESSGVLEVARYDIHGRRLAEPTKGINIIIYSDGSTKKEFVK